MIALLDSLFSDAHRLTARKRALAALHTLCERRDRLGLFVDGATRELPSMLLDVDEDAGQLVFDIPPLVEGVIWDLRQPVRALSRFDGCHLGFRLEDIETVQWQGAQALRAQLPAQVFLLQRRQFFRVPVGSGDVGEVVLQRDGAAPMRGQCADLSAGGMRVMLELVEGGSPLHAGEQLPELRFELKGTPLRTRARVQHVDPALDVAGGRKLLPVGIAFLDKTYAFDQAVVRYVQQRDRDLVGGRG